MFIVIIAILALVIYKYAGTTLMEGFLLVSALGYAAFKKTGRKILLSIFSLILLIFIALQTDFVQNKLIKIATNKLTKALGTEVSIKNVSFSFFNKVNLDGTLIKDKHNDTLLYAGALKLRITDWFFLKDKADLKFIGLEDALIKLQRKDSVWNYQFIADYFASPNQKSSGKGIELDLKKVDLKNVTFLKNDLWRGERMYAKVASLLVDADSINFNKKAISINSITIDKPYFSILNLPSLRPDSLIPHSSGIDTGLQLNTGNLVLKVKRITINNGTLSIDANQNRPDPYFDGSHILISKLNGKFDNTTLIKDTLLSNIDLNAKERSGLELKRLKAKFRVTPHIMEFAKMDLQTNKSRIGDYYAMKYKAFNDDFSDYITNVIMDAKFKDARVYSDDIAFFAPELKQWKKEVIISGIASGTVANYTVQNLFAKAGNTTYISGSLAMKGLPDINKTSINFNNGNFQTNYNDLIVFAPIVKTVNIPDLPALGTILFRGNFNGSLNNFVTIGSISTSIGAVTANINMQLPKNKDASYSGTITTTQFNIGKFLKYDLLGLVDFNGKISGSNFSIDKLKTSIEGNITSLVFNDYTYHNITTNGIFQKKYFNGEVKIGDPNLDFNSQVEIDLSKAQPSYNILGDLVKSNLKTLNFLNKDMSVTGLLDVNFSGTNIDNFLGTAKFLNANIKSDKVALGFDSLTLKSAYIDSIKYLTLSSNDFNAKIFGQFNILDLPDNFQSFLHRYYPSYIAAPSATLKKQQFTVALNTNYIEPYLRLFDKKLSGLNDLKAEGIVNTRTNNFALDIKVPYAKYDHYSITGADIQGIGNLDTLSVNGTIADIQVSDSLSFPNSTLSVKASNDHSVVSIKTSANNTLNGAELNANLLTAKDGLTIYFNPSSFILNDKKWNLEKEGEITVRKNYVFAKNVKFSQGFQEITVETEPDDGDNKNNLMVKLKNVVLGDIVSLFFKDPKLEAVTTGEIHLHDFYGKFNVEAELKAEQFRIDDDSVGLVTIKGGYISKTGMIPFSVQSLNKNFNFSADGYYNSKDSVESPLNINTTLNGTNVDYVNKFLKGIFSNLTGYATGNLTVKGNPNAPSLTGRVKLQNAGMKVDYTQVYYSIDSADIRFDEDGIDFGEMTIQDPLKNKATVKGKLYEKGFKNFDFDFSLLTNKLLLIDTKPKDNQQFYGRAIGKTKMIFKGKETDCKMTIVGEATDSSHIYIPNTMDKESGDADFIVFKQYGTEMAKEESKSNFNLLVDLDLSVNRKVQIDVILDDLTGDVIKATGDGRLKIRAGTSEKTSIRGRYDIDRGSYNFNFQSIVRRPFILKPESGNYIEWTGDPMNANIHIDAQYTAENVSANDLIGNQNQSGLVSSKSYRGPVYVIASLSDKLIKPTFAFKIDFPQGSPIKNDPVFNELINKIEKDDNEILKQVTYLIVFSAFAPYGQGNGGANINIASIGVNTLSQLVTKEATRIVDNLLYKAFHDKNLHIDLGTSVYSSIDNSGLSSTGSSTNAAFDRSSINFKVGYSLFNEKVIVTVGGNWDFGFTNATTQNGSLQFLPDFNAELVLTKDRKLRGIVFSKNSLYGYGSGTTGLGKQIRTGVGLSYKRDFEHNFFERKNPKPQPAKKEEDATSSIDSLPKTGN